MQPALSITHLFPPIAAATIVTAVLFALMWRSYQTERKTGEVPGSHIAAGILYAGGLSLFLYLRQDAPLRGYPDLFGAAMVGEAFGVVVTFALVQAFVVMRGRPWRERAFPAVASVAFTTALFIGFFTGR